MSDKEKENDVHLGDGVYVSFDGYYFWLAVNHHENKVIALEDFVVDRLIKYVKDTTEKMSQQKNK